MRALWVDAWWRSLGIDDMPIALSLVVVLLAVFFLVVLPSAYLISLLDRKFVADLQARVGPNRSGPFGIFQPLADITKLLQKEIRHRRTRPERVWIALHTFALFSTLAVLPLGGAALLVDSEVSVFLPFWSILILALGSMLVGLSQQSVPGWFGGIRSGAQTLTGFFPALLCVLTAGVHAGGYSWTELAAVQGSAPFAWGICSQPPFQAIAFLVFLFAGLILLGAEPFDGAVSKRDIQGGVGAHLEGRDRALFLLGRFYAFFFWSVLTVVVFLGAWNLPLSLVESMRRNEMDRLLPVLELCLLLVKTWTLMLGIVWFVRSNPRIRSDQVTELSWRVLGPLALLSLAGATFWVLWKGGAP